MLIHQLHEEINENDLSTMVQQLQKENKELQQLVVKYKELEDVETTSTGTQTDEIHIEKAMAMTQTNEVQLCSYRLCVAMP